jgi:energy-coupling factor transporter ATP-binding protein EcfA2
MITNREDLTESPAEPDLRGEQGSSPGRPPIITNISAKRLFSRYSYSIPSHSTAMMPGEYNRLILLYGDNGSGKTTLLNPVYHLLSPAGSMGHRKYLWGTPFERFSVSLSGDSSISVHRSCGELHGSYRVTLRKHGTITDKLPMEFDDEGYIDPDEKHLVRLVHFIENLQKFSYYLTENRTFSSDILDDDEDDLTSIRVDRNRAYRE